MTPEPNALEVNKKELRAKAESSVAYCARHPGVEPFVEVDAQLLLAMLDRIAKLEAGLSRVKHQSGESWVVREANEVLDE